MHGITHHHPPWELQQNFAPTLYTQNAKTSPVQQTTGSQVGLKNRSVQVHNRILYASNNSK